MANKKQSEQTVVVTPQVKLWFKHGELVDVPGQQRQDVKVTYQYEINGELYEVQSDIVQGSLMPTQTSQFLRQMRVIQSNLPGADVSVITSDPYLFNNIQHYLFHAPSTIVQRIERYPQLLVTLERIGEVIDTFNSFEIEERDVPEYLRPRSIVTMNGFGKPLSKAEAKTSVFAQAAAAQAAAVASKAKAAEQPAGRAPAPVVDRRFTSGEASIKRAQPKQATVTPFGEAKAQPKRQRNSTKAAEVKGPEPVTTEELFPAEQQDQAA